MRVLHIITGLAAGGAEEQLRLLLRQLPAEAQCEVVTLTEPGAVAEGIRADGIPVTHLGMNGNRDLAALPRLVRLIREGRYDLVHTHLYRACLYGRLAARLAGVRAVLATEHSLGDEEIEGRPITPAVRALYLAGERLGTATVAVSDSVARRLRDWGVPAARLHTVPNGIDAHRFRFDPARRAATRARLGIADDAFVVGGVGRLVPGKRFGTLVDAIVRLPDARLLLAGAGPEYGALRAQAAAGGAAERVRLLGECGDGLGSPGTDPADRTRGTGTGTGTGTGIPQLLAAVDVFVSASAEETFGLAVLEALAAGLPVLYAACPAVQDLPADEAPGARRVTGGAGPLAAALAGHMSGSRTGRTAPPDGQPPARLPVPPVVHRYDIARSADQLMTLYRAVAISARRPASVPSPSALTTR